MMHYHIGHIISVGVSIFVYAMDYTEFHVIHSDETIRRADCLIE